MNNKTRYVSDTSLQLQLPVFFQPWWLDRVSRRWDVAIAEEQGKITGVWPYCMEQKVGIRIIRNPLLMPYAGPFFLPGLAPEAIPSAFEQLWQQLPAWDSFNFETTTGFNEAYLLQQQGFSISELATYEIALHQTTEALWAGMNKNHRHLIRQAASLHRIEEGKEHTEALLRLHKQTFARKRKPYPYSANLIRDLVLQSMERNAGNLYAAVDSEGNVTACIFTVNDRQKRYLLFSAVDAAHAHPGAVRMLIWEAIQAARAGGQQIFDFEGSMDPGVAAFFKRFGGERKTYLCASRNKSLLWKMKKALLG